MQIAKLFVISKVTLYCLINGWYNQVLYSILIQKLIFKEKKFIKSWILKI